jgi:16S rRNA processing protein RimM
MDLQVARIGKPHGIRGEVTVQLFTDAPEERFEPGAVFRVEPAAQGPLTISSARWNKEILVLGFEEVPDRNAAELLRGAKLFIESDDTADEDGDAWYEHELVGLIARVGDQVIGKVSALRTMTVQDLLIIERTDGEEILVPFVEEIVPEVDVEAGFVILNPPEGLLELNLPGSNQAESDDDEGGRSETKAERN